jgi:DNA-binding XRE family transcriptional regulator
MTLITNKTGTYSPFLFLAIFIASVTLVFLNFFSDPVKIVLGAFMSGKKSVPGITFSLSILSLRERLGWTQKQLAEYLGVSYASVNRWENGRAKPLPIIYRAINELEEESYKKKFREGSRGLPRKKRGPDKSEKSSR